MLRRATDSHGAEWEWWPLSGIPPARPPSAGTRSLADDPASDQSAISSVELLNVDFTAPKLTHDLVTLLPTTAVTAYVYMGVLNDSYQLAWYPFFVPHSRLF